MTGSTPIRTRLFVSAPLGEGVAIGLDRARAHYLMRVLRLDTGDGVGLFNGRDGEWAAQIDGFGKSWCSLTVKAQRRTQEASPDLALLFAPIKRARIDFLVEKATELGCRRIQPVMTHRTNVARVNTDRLRTNAQEAAEQTERLDLPEIPEPAPLESVIAAWPEDRPLLAAMEAGTAVPIGEAAATIAATHGSGGIARAGAPDSPPLGVLIGPEGGFSPAERAWLLRTPAIIPVGLGPRLLRADTAAVAALSVVQAITGDWGRRPPDRDGDGSGADRWAWPENVRPGQEETDDPD